MKKYFLVFDVGGTNLEGALGDSQGHIYHYHSTPSQNHLGKKQVASNLLGLAQTILALSPQKISAISLGWPSSANMSLTGAEIKKILIQKFNLPVYLDNDANLFTLGESVLGQAKVYRHVVGVTMGTGIGCGLVIDRELYYGQGGASEFGHVTIDYRGARCSCGSFGCWEEYAGKKGLVKLAKKYKLKTADGSELYQLALKKNKKAILLWQEFGFFMGVGLASLINAYHPEIIILGGKISRAHHFFYQTMEREIKKRALLSPCPIKVSHMANAALVGASILAKQKTF